MGNEIKRYPGKHSAENNREGYTSGRRSSRKKSGPPPIIYLGLAVIIIIILLVVLLICFASGLFSGSDEPEDPASSSPALSSSLPSEENSPSPSPSPSSAPEPTAPPEKSVERLDMELVGSMLKVGNSGFELYSFITDVANEYSMVISGAADTLEGEADVYNIIVPTAADIVLPESVLEEYNTDDQKKAINYIYSSVQAQDPDVSTVDAYTALKLRNNDYLYFRTDNRWTQLGAYYAYEEFCGVRGFEAKPLDYYEKADFGGYAGNLCSQDQSLSYDPDTVEAYYSPAATSMDITQSDGAVLENFDVIMDGSEYSPGNLCLIFTGGDQPYGEVTNHDMEDGPSCVVVKDSFGNAFVPFLADHYRYIYVADSRYYSGSIPQLVRDTGSEDLIIINSISATRNEYYVDALKQLF